MTREELVEHFRACDAMAYQDDPVETVCHAVQSDAGVLADWLECRECAVAVPAVLLDLALAVSTEPHEVSDFLRAAHCCACRKRCACGGYASQADLVAVITCFEDAHTPPRRVDYWDAAWAYNAVHAAHHVYQHRLIVCDA